MLIGLALLALAVAALTVVSIASEPAYFTRLTEGEFPSGFNPIAGQMGVMIGIPCLVFAAWTFCRTLRLPYATKSVHILVMSGRIAVIALVPMAALAWGLTIR